MRPAPALACAAAFAALTAAPALAQETVGRFQFQPLEGGGYVMLDTQTGQMKQCRQLARELVCGSVSTDVAAGDAGALLDRIEALEARIAALESRAPVAGLPPEEEFERGIGYMERFFRMFMGLVREFEGERAPSPPPAPERT